jgi:rRNA maturation RNase YbeY
LALQFHNADHGFRCPQRRSIRQWVHSLVDEHKRSAGELSVIFCTDEYLLKMNQDHLNHDYYTDIITFDYSEGQEISGDLFVSIDRVRENAKTSKSLFFNELLRVIAHGHLHLIGFNDKQKQEQLVMRAQEERWIASFQKNTP